jgi:Sulfotransferase family
MSTASASHRSRDAAATGPCAFHITGRARTNSTRIAGLDDFQLQEIAAREDLCAAVAERPNITPYCLDHKNRRMVFAETPPEVDVSSAPLFYRSQHEAATRLIAIPYDLVHQVAMRLPAQCRELVFVYSVGRCGSTLMSNIWRCLGDTCSLSEPDVFTDINYRRGTGDLTHQEAVRLLGSAIRLFNRLPRPRKRLVIKFRAQCIGLAELVHGLHPTASLVFMYRNALDCIDSRVRVFGEQPLPEPVFRQAFSYAQSQAQAYRRLRQLAQPLLIWLGCVHNYLRMRECGLPLVAFKYEELLRNPIDSVTRLFAYCGASDASVEQACSAMTEDAHAGTVLARNTDGLRTLSSEDFEFLRAFFAEHVRFAPDATLPGTLNFDHKSHRHPSRPSSWASRQPCPP